MIEEAESETYYYHGACPERSRGDALGSVVALSDSSGDTVQTYEYTVYGQPAVEDADHPNPYMFAGRRFDIEIGLYYNRARYYNPFTGRFLQMDPVGYDAGMNLYMYCANNPLAYIDPLGLKMWGLYIGSEDGDYLWFRWHELSAFTSEQINQWHLAEEYDFIVDCNEDERELLEIGFQDIFNLDTGKELLLEMKGTELTILLDPDVGENMGGAYAWSNKSITWNYTFHGDGAPSYMVLAHELIHAYLHKENILVPESFIVVENIMDPDYWAWEEKCEARVDGVHLTLIYPTAEVKAFDYRCARFTMNQLRWETGFLPPIENRTVQLWEEEE